MNKTPKQDRAKNEPATIPLPLIFCRSALFTASRQEIVPAFDKKLIFTSGPWRVSYTGPLLRQQDLDVWSTCLRLVQKSRIPPGGRLTISRSQLLKEMGVGQPSSTKINELIQKLERLRTALLTVEGPVSVTRANLLAVFNEENAGNVSTQDRIFLAFDPYFAPLLENHVAEISVETSLRLKQVLSKWLYRYASTCSGEFRVGIEKLREWSGNSEDLEFYDHSAKQLRSRKAMPLPEFRRGLQKAIDEIKGVAQDEFQDLSLDRHAGESGEGQIVICLSERAKVLIKKQVERAQPTKGQNRGRVVL